MRMKFPRTPHLYITDKMDLIMFGKDIYIYISPLDINTVFKHSEHRFPKALEC